MEISPEGDDMIELYKAAGSGCMITLSRLKEKDPHFLHRISLTSFSETPLHISALVGHLEFSKALLLLKPQLTRELDSHRRCPLHLASAEGHTEIVQALLDENKDACLVSDQDGRIPLHYAAQRGRVDVVRELIAVQPNSTQVMVDGIKETILHLCVKYDQLEALKLLVESVSDEGEFLTSKDHISGNTIFHLAVILKQIETIKYLLSVSKVKEEVDSLNYMGFTALQMLENCPKDFKSFTIRNILMDAGAKVERVNNLSPLSTIAAVQHESTNPSQLKEKWRKWLEYLNYRGDWIEETRGALMVVATVITTITFQPAISPPGGVWQTNITEDKIGTGCNTTHTCVAGTSVFGSFRYKYFMVVNTISFTASLCAIFLLISGFPLKNKVCMGFMTSAMSIALIFLGFAYARAISLVNPVDPLLQAGRIIAPTYVLIVMIAGVLLIHTIRFIVWLLREIRKLIPQMQG